MKPGTVVYADLEPVVGHEQGQRRPVIVLSAKYGTTYVIVPVTSTPRSTATRVPFQMRGRTSYAMCEQIRTLSVDRFDAQAAGSVDHHALAAIRGALAGILGIGAP